MNFAVLASGYGGNLQAIIDALKKQRIKADLKVVISDKKDAYALRRARKVCIPALYINQKNFKNREDFDRETVAQLKKFNIDFVVLAGYMRLLSPYFVEQYRHKILNIHPSLLPAFKGLHGIRDAFEYGVRVTGVSVHFVIDEVDCGMIILQEPVRVTPQDTLAILEAKIHRVEHRIYPKAIDLFARGKLKIRSRKVTVLP